jgi:hypothetical protein
VITSNAKKIIAPINEGPIEGKNEARDPINKPHDNINNIAVVEKISHERPSGAIYIKHPAILDLIDLKSE